MSPEEVDLETRPLVEVDEGQVMDSKVRVKAGRKMGRRAGSRSPPVLQRRWGSVDEGEEAGLGLGLGLGLGMRGYQRLP